MKLINIKSLKIGEKLSSAIRMQDGRILLSPNTAVSDSYLKKLADFGINCVYIEDDIYDEVVITPAIDDETKTKALAIVASAFASVEKGTPIDESKVKAVTKSISKEVYSHMDEPISLFNTYAINDSRFLHSVNVAIMTATIAITHGCGADLIDDYVTGALLHDIKLPTMNEDTDPKHALEGTEFIKSGRGISARSYIPVLMHHERYDGTGGPKKLAGDAINEGARMIAVADMYDNLLYGYGRKKMDPHHAIEFLMMESGKSLDPTFLKIFTQNVAIYPTGATVVLNNGFRAIVTRQNAQMPSRPKVRLCMPNREDCIEINLLTNRTLFVDKVEL